MHALLDRAQTISTRVQDAIGANAGTGSGGNKVGGVPVIFSSQGRREHQTLSAPFQGKSLQETLFEATAAAKIWTSRVAMHLNPEARARFFRQLDLIHDHEEWHGNDPALKLESYKTFIRAVLYMNIDSKPGLALMPNGYLLATWQRGTDRLSIEFLPADRGRYVVSRQIDGHPERAAGETTLSRLRAVLAPFDAEHWFSGR